LIAIKFVVVLDVAAVVFVVDHVAVATFVAVVFAGVVAIVTVAAVDVNVLAADVLAIDVDAAVVVVVTLVYCHSLITYVVE
jgi:hypothetical protein